LELQDLITASVYEKGGYNDVTVCIFFNDPLV
jgi:hypothetical protein